MRYVVITLLALSVLSYQLVCGAIEEPAHSVVQSWEDESMIGDYESRILAVTDMSEGSNSDLSSGWLHLVVMSESRKSP